MNIPSKRRKLVVNKAIGSYDGDDRTVYTTLVYSRRYIHHTYIIHILYIYQGNERMNTAKKRPV